MHYSSVFESYYLHLTSEFYAAESFQKSGMVNAQEFLRHCTLRGSEEDARSRHVLPKSSWGMVKKVTESSLLDGRLTWLAKEGRVVFKLVIFSLVLMLSANHSDRCTDEREEDRRLDQDVWSICSQQRVENTLRAL